MIEPYMHLVSYYETDKMGIVHNSNYLRIFEDARLDHMAKSGLPYVELESAGIIIPQTESYVKYEKTAKYADTLCCLVKLVHFDGIRLEYNYEISLQDSSDVIARGWTKHCFLDENTRLPLSLKKRNPEYYNILVSMVS